MRLNTEAHLAQPTIEFAAPEESTITSLAVIETASAALVYAPGALTALVDKLKKEVRAQLATLDVSIPKDRARMISLSFRVATAKVKLDKLGDSLIEEHRAVVTVVNADRKSMRDDLDAFKVEVRKPVTDLENAEKERVAAHEAIIRQIEDLGKLDRPLNLEEIEARAGQVSALADRNWQEFKQRAVGAKVMAMEALSEAQDRAVEARRLREQAERLEAEAQERAILEDEQREARIAAETRAKNKAHRLKIDNEGGLSLGNYILNSPERKTMSLEAWGDCDQEFGLPDGYVSEQRAEEMFKEGARACREMLARFVEQGGDAKTAESIRANWNPSWGKDPGRPDKVTDDPWNA